MTLRFPNTGEPFSGINACEAWLKANGYSCGSMQGPHPVGVLKGDFLISKWRGMTRSEKQALDGRITWDGESPRDGDAVLTLTEGGVA